MEDYESDPKRTFPGSSSWEDRTCFWENPTAFSNFPATKDLVETHRLLHDFSPAWRSGVGQNSIHEAVAQEGEDDFIRLCDMIVEFIEDPSCTNVEVWYWRRLKFHKIISIGTAVRFAQIVVQGTDPHLRHMIKDFLPQVLPNRLVYDRLMVWSETIPLNDVGEGFGYNEKHSDHLTGLRIYMYYSRILRRRDEIYQKLFGCAVGQDPDEKLYSRVREDKGEIAFKDLVERDERSRVWMLRDARAVEAILAATPKYEPANPITGHKREGDHKYKTVEVLVPRHRISPGFFGEVVEEE